MKIKIERKSFSLIQCFVNACDQEITGLGKVEKIGENLLISNPLILKQTVSGSSADIEPEALARFTYDCVEKGENPGDYKFLWHSHVEMGVFWSGTDQETIKNWNTDFLISSVLNKKGKILTRLDLFKPLRLTIDNLEIDVVEEKDIEMESFVKKEISEKVEQEIIPLIHHSPFGEWGEWQHNWPKKKSYYEYEYYNPEEEADDEFNKYEFDDDEDDDEDEENEYEWIL